MRRLRIPSARLSRLWKRTGASSIISLPPFQGVPRHWSAPRRGFGRLC